MNFTMFKPGDVVTVQPLEHSYWMDVLEHKKDQFTVKSVTPSCYPCCAGHPQQLLMTDGTHASGAWFDPLIKEKVWCSGKHYGSDFDTEYYEEGES